MNSSDVVLITGASGMVGKSLTKTLKGMGFSQLLTPRSSELDLRNQIQTLDYFAKHSPQYVFHLAGHIGGIKASIARPVEFMYENQLMALNIINACHEKHVHKLLFVGSSCIYPRECQQPMKEEYMLTGALEPTNEGYALAKISGIKLCEYMHKQHGHNFISLMPPNLYGLNDHFETENSHVISALIYKMHHAKTNGIDQVEIWGSGKSRREFLFVQDFVDAMIFFMRKHGYKDLDGFINVGSGVDLTIKELAEAIKNVVGFEGELRFNTERPDGMPLKLLDVTRAEALGWKHKVSLEEGLRLTYDWYLEQLKAGVL